MQVTSVNLGSRESIQHGEREFVTGINKRSRRGAVFVSEQGLADDAVIDTEHHGGRDQAVYVYCTEDYEWWSERLGRELEPGAFGDNLTISGLPADMRSGDRLLIGDLVLEATSPRIPCSTLAARMQDSSFGMQFRRAERPGAYCRVLNEGDVSAGDSVTYVDNPDCDVTIVDQFRLNYELSPSADELQRVLAAPIAERMRDKFERKLAAIEGDTGTG